MNQYNKLKAITSAKSHLQGVAQMLNEPFKLRVNLTHDYQLVAELTERENIIASGRFDFNQQAASWQVLDFGTRHLYTRTNQMEQAA